MLTAKFAFCFLIFGVFEETVSWTIDLPQVRKYFFEKSLDDRDRYDARVRDREVYDNIHTHSLHTDYDKYRDNYADDYKYHGYMEQKVHEAVRNGSAYLEGLRRAIEAYTARLESCRRLNVTANIIQFRPNFSTTNLTSSSTADLTNPSLSTANLTNFNLPTNFTISIPPNNTYISQLSTNFTNLMELSKNYTLFNVSEGLKECVRAELASEHVRRLAQLAVWAAGELQDKLYADKYKDEHGREYGPEHDDTLVLRLAWFLDRLAHLTGYDPRPGDFLPRDKDPSSPPTPPPLSLMPTLVSTSDLQRLMSCMSGPGGAAPDRCAFVTSGNPDTGTYMSRGWPAPPTPDLRPSASENQEYIYSEQDFTDDDMPLSLPQRSTKQKRSIPTDPLQNLLQYYTKYKAWDGSNQNQVKDSSEITSNSIKGKIREKRSIFERSEIKDFASSNDIINTRAKRSIKKLKHFKIENPIQDLSSIVKHKIGAHIHKDEKEANMVKKFFDKLVKKPKTEVRVLKFKNNNKKEKLHVASKTEVGILKFKRQKRSGTKCQKLNFEPKTKELLKLKRSVKYSKKVQPRIPLNPQGDISYYVKNKPGRNYDYNAGQAALVRAGVEQVFQTGNILVVQRYGSNYNPANTMQIAAGYMEGYSDV